ncbi:MAG TPA: response regulator [Polyangiaceae bacterium]|nr:response regulator [Polyangiaceae bacterium]
MNRGTALVVDDSPDARDFLTVVVAEAGYRVLCAESVQHALGILRVETAIDLVIVDYNLEDGTGAALLHQAINEGRLNPQTTPTIMCTAYRYVELPPNVTMLQKPVEPEALLRAIRAAATTRFVG